MSNVYEVGTKVKLSNEGKRFFSQYIDRENWNFDPIHARKYSELLIQLEMRGNAELMVLGVIYFENFDGRFILDYYRVKIECVDNDGMHYCKTFNLCKEGIEVA